jgi:hypothetical protein
MLGNPQKRILGVSDYPLDAFPYQAVFRNEIIMRVLFMNIKIYQTLKEVRK